MIKIEQNIAPPRSGTTIGVTLDQMQVGDSFLLDNVTVDLRQNLHLQMRKRKLAGKKFISRTILGDVRVWRLA